MSGHSKWATTKRAKAAVDAKRGAIFTKLSNLITIAARKGGDPTMNFALRIAVDRAREANMPKDNVERAIKRGTGELGGGQIEELIYEAIGPANSQIIIKCLTDNRNRAASNIRHILGKHNASLGAAAWNFEQQGVIMISAAELAKVNWEELELSLIDLDVLNLDKAEEGATIYTTMADLQKIEQFLTQQGLSVESAEIEYVAKDKKTLLTPASKPSSRICWKLWTTTKILLAIILILSSFKFNYYADFRH